MMWRRRSGLSRLLSRRLRSNWRGPGPGTWPVADWDWTLRSFDETYAAIFLDAIVVKVCDGQVANRPFYAAIGVARTRERDILAHGPGLAPAGSSR